MIEIITDGACRGNPGPGGWAALIERDGAIEEHGGAEEHTTNNRMELRAAIEGLRRVPSDAPVRITTDSQYLINGITRWIKGWRVRDWKTIEGRPVENRDLWEELDTLAGKRTTWRHVRGHTGDPLNERADTIAHSYASSRQPPATARDRTLPTANTTTRRPGVSYLSLIGSGLMRHATWEECRARVHGVSGARYKKCTSSVEERATVLSWRLNESVLAALDEV